MALQGTLDTFALPDVLRLLASTKKTGRLRLTGDRGNGSLWVDGGGVVDAEATGGPAVKSPTDVLFELLRYRDGSFSFDVGSTSPNGGERCDVEPLIADSEQQLAEWRDIEAVVPSMDAWATLVPTLPNGEVVLDADRWRTVVSVGSGSTVAAIAEALDLEEVPVCRHVKELVEMGLVSIGSDEDEYEDEEGYESDPAPIAMPEPLPMRLPVRPMDWGSEPETESSLDNPLDLPIEPVAEFEDVPEHEEERVPFVPMFASAIERVGQDLFPSPSTPTPPPPPPLAPVMVDDADEAQEVARQLATLSPRAARAVAAAARAETDEEREAALAEVTAEDDTPINRGLLLRFLGSVNS